LKQAYENIIQIRENIRKISKELENEDYWKFRKSFSPGLQEYIEAVAFYEYLKFNSLLTLKKAEEDLVKKKNHYIYL